MYRTGDPISDFAQRDREEAEWLDKLPKCADCGEPIQDDHYFLINDKPVCPCCLEDNYKKVNEYGG
jgi:formylmethanofuran dehydrogenase subunit E